MACRFPDADDPAASHELVLTRRRASRMVLALAAACTALGDLALTGGVYIVLDLTWLAGPRPILRHGDTPLRLRAAPEPWPDGRRFAAVSEMESGGVSVQVAARSGEVHTRQAGRRRRQEPEDSAIAVGPTDPGAAAGSLVYPLSGADRGQLAALLDRIGELAPSLSDAERGDLACQLGHDSSSSSSNNNNNRTLRVAIVASTSQQLADRACRAARLLAALEPGRLITETGIFAADGASGRVVLLFPGQGGHAGPAAPVPAAAIFHASLTALRWLDRLGVTAAAAVGYGLGEITGLFWAGSLSAPDTAWLVARRGAVLGSSAATRTAMIRVGTDTDTARALCAGTDLVVAAYEGPRSQVLAGSVRAVRAVARRAADSGLPAAVQDVPRALHSPAMRACTAPLRSILAEIRFAAPRRRLVSTVTGHELTAHDDLPGLLRAQLTSPVLFARALETAADGAALLCEAGSGGSLTTLAAGCCDIPAVSLWPGSRDDMPVANAAAALFAAGAIASLEPLLAGRPARPIDIWRDRAQAVSPRAPGGVGGDYSERLPRPLRPSRTCAPTAQEQDRYPLLPDRLRL